jgi:hypothetical protein
MTARRQYGTKFVPIACGFVLLAATGCHPVGTTQPPPPTATCGTTTQSGVSTQTGTARGTVGSSQFTATLTRSVTISSGGAASGSGSRVVVQRISAGSTSPATSLQIDTQSSPGGAVQISATFGAGFQGVTQITFVSADSATVQGTINGQAIVPFPIGSDPRSIRLANGSAVPAMTVDADTGTAVPALLAAVQTKCGAPPPTQSAAAAPGGANKRAAGDPPAHLPNFSQSACFACCLGCFGYNIACFGAAAAGALACGPFYGACLAGALIGCEVTTAQCYGDKSVTIPDTSITVGDCHLFGAPGTTAGSPCCPVLCAGGCCGPGESCAAQLPGPPGTLCCSSGTTACGINCCVAGQTCVGGSTCCANGSVCGTSCCAAGQTCTGGNTCCNSSNACGSNCCSAGQICLQDSTTCCAPGNVCGRNNCCNPGDSCASNGTCCAAGHAVCNGICCPNANTACDPTTGACSTSCAGGAPTCGGSCCSAGQLCCQVQTSGGLQPQCVSPITGPVQGHPWCGQSAPTQIYCNNCAANQSCVSLPGALRGDEWYCQ